MQHAVVHQRRALLRPSGSGRDQTGAELVDVRTIDLAERAVAPTNRACAASSASPLGSGFWIIASVHRHERRGALGNGLRDAPWEAQRRTRRQSYRPGPLPSLTIPSCGGALRLPSQKT